MSLPLSPLSGRLRPGTFLATGHRGAAGLAPENTLAAFERGLAEGIDIIELDVQASSDGELVVIHDPTLERTTDGEGAVVDHTYAELARLDAGYRFCPHGFDSGAGEFPFRGKGVRISRLADVLATWPEQAFTVELKPSPHPAYLPAIAALLRPEAHRVIVGSFHHDLLVAFRALCSEVPTSCSAREIKQLFLLGRLPLVGRWIQTPAVALQMPRTSDHDRDRGIVLATRSFLRFAHARGIAVQVWTINDEATMRQLIALGVDGITTDRPDRLRTVRAALAEAPREVRS